MVTQSRSGNENPKDVEPDDVRGRPSRWSCCLTVTPVMYQRSESGQGKPGATGDRGKYDMWYDVVSETVLSSYISVGCSLSERPDIVMPRRLIQEKKRGEKFLGQEKRRREKNAKSVGRRFCTNI